MIGFRKRQPNPANDASAQSKGLFEEDLHDVMLHNHASPTAEQVGVLLRRSREKRGFSLGEMSQKTRIRDIYLLALEEGEVGKLPGATFVAGFLRLYAESLELQETEIIERYLATSGVSDDNLQTDVFPSPTTSRHRPSVTVVMVGLLSLLGLFFFYENMAFFESFGLFTPEVPYATPLRSDTAPEDYPGRHADLTAVAEDEGGVVSRFFDTVSVQDEVEDNGDDLTRNVRKEEEYAPIADQQTETTHFLETPVQEKSQEVEVEAARSLDVPIVDRSQDMEMESARSLETSMVEKSQDGGVDRFQDVEMETTPILDLPLLDETEKRSPAVATRPETLETAQLPETVENKDPAALIVERYPERVANADLVPESAQAVSMLASELVWVQIQDGEGHILKDMVMQPDQLFRVPPGGRFFATLGNAGGVRLRVGNRFIPYLGKPGQEIYDLDLAPEALLRRAKK